MIEDLLEYLLNLPALQALVGSRIYPLMLPQRATLPAIRYQRISTLQEAAHDGPGPRESRWQFSVHAGSYASADGAARALRAALDCRRFGPQRTTFLANDLDDYDAETEQFIRHVDVMVWEATGDSG